MAQTVTGFALRVDLPDDLPNESSTSILVDEPVTSVADLRQFVGRRYPVLSERLDDEMSLAVVNGQTILSGEGKTALANGDRVAFMRAIAGG